MKHFPNYSISNHGNIRNDKTNKMVVPDLSSAGIYYQVKLKGECKTVTCRVDLLVAVAFKPNF